MATPAAAPTPSQPAPRRSRLGVIVARHHNPLWRRTDALRSRLRVLVVLGVTTVVALSVLIGLGIYHSYRATALRYQSTHHPVQAVALTDASHRSGADAGTFTVQVRWTDATGATHQAVAATDDTTVTGDRLTVWLDSRGRITPPPGGAADSAGMAVLLGSITLLAGSTLILAVDTYTRSRLTRTDLRNWDRDWEQTEPVWTRGR